MKDMGRFKQTRDKGYAYLLTRLSLDGYTPDRNQKHRFTFEETPERYHT